MRIFILIISPVFLGLLAGLLYLLEIDISELRGPAIAAGLLAFGAVVAPRTLAGFRGLGRLARNYPAGYRNIYSARVTEAELRAHEGPIRIGEFLIEANNQNSAGRLSHLPTGSILQTIEKGRRYRLRFPIPPGIRGEASDRLYVEEAARANGYPGRIQ